MGIKSSIKKVIYNAFNINECNICFRHKRIHRAVCQCNIKYCNSCFRKLNRECCVCSKKRGISQQPLLVTATRNNDEEEMRSIYINEHDVYITEMSTYAPYYYF